MNGICLQNAYTKKWVAYTTLTVTLTQKTTLMATIKAVVRNARADGFLPVYIRIVHKSKPGYIKTDKIVSPKGIAKSGDIIDPVVNEYCAKAILRYSDMLNRVDSHNWSVRDVINYLNAENDDVCFCCCPIKLF